MINIIHTNKQMLSNGPRPISEAKLDGTKYIVWDKYIGDWCTASYWGMTKALHHGLPTPKPVWARLLDNEFLYEVTHFVEYFPDPTENK